MVCKPFTVGVNSAVVAPVPAIVPVVVDHSILAPLGSPPATVLPL